MSDTRMSDTRRTAEWSWLTTMSGALLHAPDVWDPDDDETSAPGRAGCGLRALLMIPGVFARMGASRCIRCCEATGMPPGVGSPKNSEQCRPIVEQRLART